MTDRAQTASKQSRVWLTLAVAAFLAFAFRHQIGKFFEAPPYDPGPAPAATGDPHVDDLRHCKWLVESHWSWREMRIEEGLDLEAEFARALAMLDETEDDPQHRFFRALTRFVASLRDGHAHVSLDKAKKKTPKKWPFRLRECSDGFFVDGVSPELFLQRSLVRGDRVLQVDGRSIDAYIAEREAFVMASTPTKRRLAAVRAVGLNTTRDRLRVTVHRSQGTQELVVACADRAAPVPLMSWRAPKRERRVLEDGCVYFKPGSFKCSASGFAAASPEERLRLCAPDFDAFRDAFHNLDPSDRLILDLRGNPGGTDILGQALCRHLVGEAHYYSLSSKPFRNGAFVRVGHWHKAHAVYAKFGHGSPRFGGKLAVLIDEDTFSVADNVATCLRHARPDALFVGQPSGGGSGAPRSFTLPATGARVSFCTMRVYGADGAPIEGRGVRPDHALRPSGLQVAQSEDAVLMAAQRLLR